MKRPTITIKTTGQKISARSGTDLLTALRKGGIFIASGCGGKGVCGKCRVKIISGSFKTKGRALSKKETADRIFLACRTVITGNIAVELLPETILPSGNTSGPFQKDAGTLLSERPSLNGFPYEPLTKKHFLSLPEPGMDDAVSDFDRLCLGLKKAERYRGDYVTGPGVLAKLPLLLRHSRWKITAVTADNNRFREIISVEQGDTSGKNYGIAVDIGTTTVSAGLIDLVSGKIIASDTAYNSQNSYGEDIISRIIYSEKKGGLDELHRQVCKTINSLIGNMASGCSVNPDDITAAVFSGNMTMMHLFMKIPPAFLRRAPYVPAANFFPEVKPPDTGIKINPSGVIATVGGAYPYVGGDITSGILATGMYKTSELNVLIDIGTNGEIVLGGGDWMMCCAASAGPAFEGSGVKNGMRAVAGAVQGIKISKTGAVEIQTVDDAPPLGICGSGYIDIIGEFFNRGIIDRAGVFIAADRRIREGEAGKEFVLVKKKKGSGGEIVVTQVDLQNLIRAKAAIFSALYILIKKSGIDIKEIENVYVAGGFGNCLNVRNAVRIGLLPDIPAEKYRFMGNASMTGAEACLISSEARELTKKIVSKMTYLELSGMSEYMDEYIRALFIPHTDLHLFPSHKDRT